MAGTRILWMTASAAKAVARSYWYPITIAEQKRTSTRIYGIAKVNVTLQVMILNFLHAI